MTNSIEYLLQPEPGSEQSLALLQLRISESGSMYIIHKAITKQLHEKRQGSANCKSRSEVRGGGRKPWKQKGTGRARAGSSRSPLWRGGGVIFGPKAKKYSQKVNKKERQLAVRNMLFNKKDVTFSVHSSLFDFREPKTKLLTERIAKLNIDKTEKILIIMAKKNKNACLASRSLSNIEIIAANQLNLLSIIKAKYILVEINAAKIITEVYNGSGKTKRVAEANQKANSNR